MSQVENDPRNAIAGNETQPVFQSEVLKLIQEKPGISIGEIQKHFYPRSKQTISAMLGRFRRMGVATSKESKWFPVNPWQISPEFQVLAGVLLGELNSLQPEARENHLARRLQEEFQKQSGLYQEEELIDENTWLEIQERRIQLAEEIEIRRDAAMIFGKEETKGWSLSECKKRITEVYDRWWKQSGGRGSHPLSPR